MPRFVPAPHALRRAALLGAFLCLAGGAVAAERSAASYYEDAQARFDRNNASGAVLQAKNAIQRDPNLLAARLLLAKALLKDGQAAAAEAEFEQAQLKGVSVTEIALPYAQALMLFGNSEKLLERVKPDGLAPAVRAEVLALRATAQADRGDMAAAAREVLEARGADPRSLAPLRADVDLALRGRDSARAATIISEALARAPDDAQFLTLQGAMLQGKGDVNGALAYFARALKKDPRLVDAMVARASLLIDLKRFEEALPDLDCAAALVPREPRVSYLKSLVLASRGDVAGSRAQLADVTHLIDALPADFVARQPPLLMLGALASQATGRIERARALLELYVRRMPKDPAGRKLLAGLYVGNGDTLRVTDLLEPMLHAEDADPQVLGTLAALRMQQGRFREAAEAAERAAQLSGGNPALTAQMGFARIANHQPDIGLVALRKSFDKDPAQFNVASALVTLYLRRNDLANAAQVAEAAQRHQPSSPEALNLLGAVKGASRKPAEAAAAYARAIALAPDYLPAQLNLARVEFSEGKVEVARQRLAAVLRAHPQDSLVLTELGRIEQGGGHLPEALALFEKAYAVAPEDSAAGMALLALYPRLNKPAEATLSLARKLAVRRPGDAAVQEAVGRASLAVGDQAGARAALTSLSRLAGDDPERLVAVGQLQLAAGAAAEAAASAEKALLQKPGLSAALVLQIEAETQAGALPRAASLQRAFAERSGNSAAALRLGGDLALARNQPQDALAAYRAAFAKASSSELALRQFEVAFRGGEGDKAMPALEAWLKAHPEDLQARAALAEGNLRLGRLAAAREAYEALLARAPQHAVAANNLAQVLLLQNDPGAMAMAERAVRLAPEDANALDTLGWLKARSGGLDAALKTLREARLRAPDARDIRFHLAWVLKQSGKRDEAKTELTAALEGKGMFESRAEAELLRRELGV